MRDAATTSESHEQTSTSNAENLTRRGFLLPKLGTAAATAGLVARRASARPSAGAAPLPLLIYRLLTRATFGWRLEDQVYAESIGYDAWLDEQLAPDSIDDSVTDGYLGHYPTIQMTPEQVETLGLGNQAQGEAQKARLTRAYYSKRQLLEVMVEFWSHHFNVDVRQGQGRFFMGTYQREAIRPHALGNFADLLQAVAESAAMLEYLDNKSNVANGPQENYARELMELHTLGVNGGYTEFDVLALARCLTGWRFHPSNSTTGDFGTFLFDMNQHDTGSKLLLGVDIPAGGGKSDGDLALRILRNQSACADFIATKLCRFFIDENPRPALVQLISSVFRQTQGNIAECMRTLLSQAVLQTVDFSVSRKLRQPARYITALLRITGADLSQNLNWRFLVDWFGICGQVPFEWPAPDGYPDTRAYWGTALYPYLRFASELIYDGIPLTPIDFPGIFAPLGGIDPANFVQQVNTIVANGLLSPTDLAEASQYLGAFASPGLDEFKETMVLLLQSPSFLHF